MLVEEKASSLENDGVLILDPLQGLGHQVAGAFQRLGARMLGFFAPAPASSLGTVQGSLDLKTKATTTASSPPGRPTTCRCKHSQ